MPIKLTLTGNIDRDAVDYWSSEKQSYLNDFPGVFIFEDWLEFDRTIPLMLQSDVYCSATLGEGCSLARINALVLGMPMVTTRCGEMLEFEAGADHIRLAEPGDLEGFKSTLRDLIEKTFKGEIQVRRDLVKKWRKQFHPEVECLAWQKVAKRILRSEVSSRTPSRIIC
jgi:glycosyltransferase involved in cell wall biosynthesis